MKNVHKVKEAQLTGRIAASPDTFLHEEILAPQFNYELQHLLPYYILIEKVLLLEYSRMKLLSKTSVTDIGRILDQITPAGLVPDPTVNMSDIAFAIEQFVEKRLDSEVYAWHVDRSRNDYQACAQLMFGRELLLELIEALSTFIQATHALAIKHTTYVMPGYTHYQAAQVITPGFYLAALCEETLNASRRLLSLFHEINVCPLGSGAMAGQYLQWDRSHMANLLGFEASQRHALVSVASRSWLLRLAGEVSTFSAVLSRFFTDFICWSSSEYGFIDFPDELSGISSAMPQKKNFSLLERIRGKTAHISAYYTDILMGQRNTPYTNLVETSKEAGSNMYPLFKTMQSICKLSTIIMERVQFRTDRMQEVCRQQYLEGFTLANYLTLHEHIPYRKAQVIVGHYIAAALEQHRQPWQIDETSLRQLALSAGYPVNLSREVLQSIFTSECELYSKQSVGSTHPEHMQALLLSQLEELQHLQADWSRQRTNIEKADQNVGTLLYHATKGSEQ